MTDTPGTPRDPRRRDLRENRLRQTTTASTRRKQQQPHGSPVRARRLRWRSLLAGSAAALLVAPFALPAFADSTEPDAIPVIRTLEGVQTVEVAAEAGIAAIAREQFSVTNPPPPKPVVPAASRGYSSIADTFTNNPASPVQWPFTRGVPISDGFGYRSAPCSGCSSMHQGIDMNPGAGTPIQIIADGVVSEIGNPSGELGVYAIIDHVIDGQKVSSLYAHMLQGSLRVQVGDQVKVTDIVGQVGSTGMSTGAHLHFGISLNGTPIDPFPYMKQKVGS
ncbi:M23 family metallopeptidase (plasmid) [Leifsonia sp. P73]|uniref:M23 family metallopeptidase n=1 Tax=unclassified Leifsonia TaxID=2663824 RepID=UPI00370474EE